MPWLWWFGLDTQTKTRWPYKVKVTARRFLRHNIRREVRPSIRLGLCGEEESYREYCVRGYWWKSWNNFAEVG